MRKILTVKELYQGYIVNDGKKERAFDGDTMVTDIGNEVMNFLLECGGDTCTVTIEGPDKPKEDKPQ